MSLADDLLSYQTELSPYFNPAILQRSETVFQIRFDRGEDFHLIVTETGFSFVAGQAASPTLTLYLDRQETFWDLLRGRQDSMEAFMAGRYRADGNIVLSQLLLYLFAGNDPIVAYQVQD